MKIALFDEVYLPFNNGVNVVVQLLKSELEKLGHEVYIVTYQIDGVDYSHASEERLIVLPSKCMPGKKAHLEAVYYNLSTRKLVDSLKAYHFDIIHLQNEYTLSWVAIKLAKEEHIPLVYSRHTDWNLFFKKEYTLLYPFIYPVVYCLFFHRIAQKADKVIVPSFKAKKMITKMHVKDEKIYILPSAIKMSHESPLPEEIDRLKEQYHLHKKKVMIYVGRVSREKRIMTLVKYYEKASQKISNLVFMIVGNGPYLKRIRKYIIKKNLSEKVILVGEVNHDNINNYYRLGDVFCSNSNFETQGLTYFEAINNNVPLLVYNDIVFKGIINDHENALLYKTYEEFEEKLFLSFSARIASQIRNAKETLKHYVPSLWAQQILEIYNSALSKKN